MGPPQSQRWRSRNYRKEKNLRGHGERQRSHMFVGNGRKATAPDESNDVLLIASRAGRRVRQDQFQNRPRIRRRVFRVTKQGRRGESPGCL